MNLNLIEKIKRRKQELGIIPKKTLGQNFLINEKVVEKIIVDLESKSEAANIIEIGPGLGSLTDSLIEFCRQHKSSLTLLEMDQKLAKYWLYQTQDKQKPSLEFAIQVFEGDALSWEGWKHAAEGSILVSNLPYQISSRVVIDRCLDSHSLVHMWLMFQKEVAQRLLAAEGDSEYGFLSVCAQCFFRIRKIVEAHPQSFFPPPKVASQVLHFQSTGFLDKDEKKKKLFVEFVKGLFFHPRRKWSNNLRDWYGKLNSDLAVGESDWELAFKRLEEQLRREGKEAMFMLRPHQLPLKTIKEIFEIFWMKPT